MDITEQLIQLKDVEASEPSEADTRAIYIDPILSAAGWDHTAIKREPYAGWTDAKKYIDYLLLVNGKNTMVVEAKRTGRSFDVPVELRKQRVVAFKKLRATANANLIEALEQGLRYSQHTGAQYVCLTSGTEWLFFKPSHPYRALPDARVIVFSSLDDILSDIDVFVSLITPAGIETGKAEKHLAGREVLVPYFAKRLRDAYPYHLHQTLEEEEYSHILDQLLANYLVEITDDEIFSECYVGAKSNKRVDGSLTSLITAQVRALNPLHAPETLAKEILASPTLPGVIAGRTIILHGAIGVGKTSFLRNSRLELAKDKLLEKAVWVQIDLLDFRDRPFDHTTVSQILILLCRKIQDQVSDATQKLPGQYDPDVWEHLRDIYNREVRKFQKLRFPQASDDDPTYLEAVRDYVWKLREGDPQEHLVRVIHWLTVNARLPVVLVLDNSDQLGLEFQEFLYKLSETFQQKTSAVTVIVLRTEALNSHRLREHALASVIEQYQIQQAQLPTIVARRFEAIEKQMQTLSGVTDQQKVALDRISVLMDVLNYESQLGSDAYQMIDAFGNDNLRDALRAIAAVFRSSPKQMDRFVAMQAQGMSPRLYADTVLSAIAKRDLNTMDPRPLLPNVFSGDTSVSVPYSLPVRVLQQIKSKGAPREYAISECLNDFALAGIDRDLVYRVLSRLRVDKLISVPHMLKDIGEHDAVKTTKLGEFVSNSLIGYETYYDRIIFDVTLYSEELYNRMRNIWNSGAETFKRFNAMSRALMESISAADEHLRKEMTLSLLEPILSTPLPVPVKAVEDVGAP